MSKKTAKNTAKNRAKRRVKYFNCLSTNILKMAKQIQ